MDYFRAAVNLSGNRNHVVFKTDITAAEILILQAIHGPHSVHDIQKQGPTKRTQQTKIVDRLEKIYRKVKTGPSSDRRPVLVRVFPSWPRVDLPKTLQDARIDPLLIKGSGVEDPEPLADNEPPHNDQPDATGGASPVPRNTYWKMGEELGMTPKGEVLPEGVTVIKKAEYETLQAESEGPDGSGDDNFLE